jgi:RNA polymerase sigma-70 factor (ECF subfamily)
MKDNLDLRLIESCIKGDRAAQKVLYDRLAPRMFPVCIRYVGERELAEDVLQDGFVTLFTHLDSYKGEGSFEGWARKIFVTTALMELRRKDALKMSEDLETVRGMKAEATTQLQNIGYKDLMKLITQLPPGFRTVFNMYAIEGYSHKEISDILGISETTSRTQLSRARLWLQNKIKERGYTIVPELLYVDPRGYAKMTIALAKGKHHYDKRETIKAKDSRRDMERELA